MNKIMNFISVIFWTGMIILSASARAVHNGRLPRAEVLTVKKQDFEYTFTDGGNTFTVMRRAVGIPQDLIDKDIYVIIEKEFYGETRTFAEKREIIPNGDYFSDEYAAVLYGLSAGDKIIISADRSLPEEQPFEVYYDEQ